MMHDPMHSAQVSQHLSQAARCGAKTRSGKPMPVACGDREKALPDARWREGLRRTQGGAQRQLQAWPLHRRDNRDSSVAEGEDPPSEGVDQDASRPAVIAMPEPAFTAEPLRAGLVGDELRQTPVLTPARQSQP